MIDFCYVHEETEFVLKHLQYVFVVITLGALNRADKHMDIL